MTAKSLGHSYCATRNRLYHRRKINGKVVTVLVSWIVQKCVVCGRFLGKRDRDFCQLHNTRTNNAEYLRAWKNKNREKLNARRRKYYQETIEKQRAYQREYYHSHRKLREVADQTTQYNPLFL